MIETKQNGALMQRLNRVVITGLGAITPVGLSTDEAWDSVTNGRSGIDIITQFDPSELRCQFAGEVRDFDPSEYLEKKEVGLQAQRDFRQMAKL